MFAFRYWPSLGRLQVLSEINKSVKVIPSTLDFYDIAGLVKVSAWPSFFPQYELVRVKVRVTSFADSIAFIVWVFSLGLGTWAGLLLPA